MPDDLRPPPASPQTKAVNLRVREDVRDLIDRAAYIQGRSRSDFMIDAARRAAEEAILDQTFIGVSEEHWQEVLDFFDRPPQPNEGLKRLMSRTPAWEKK